MRPVPVSLVAVATSLLLMAPVAAVAGPANQIGSATVRASHIVGQPERSLDKKKDRHKGRKGRKKHADTTAAVSATWTLRHTYTAEPENWEEITFTVKDGSATFKNDKSRIAWGDGKGTIGYHGHYYTDDRSWHPGCDTELRDSTASWSGRMEFAVFAVNQRREHGEEQKFNGWAVEVVMPSGIRPTTTGSYQDWESIAMDNCETFPIDAPMGGWGGPSFPVSRTATGRLTSDGKGVLLTQVASSVDETYTVTGHVKFSKSVEQR